MCCTASPDAKFSNLVATAHVSFTGGVFNCKVNGTPDSVERDLWTTVNTFTISAAAKLSPTVLYEPTGGVVGRSWSVIVAGRFSDAVLPTFPTGVTGWGASESGTDLVLTKKPPQ